MKNLYLPKTLCKEHIKFLLYCLNLYISHKIQRDIYIITKKKSLNIVIIIDK